MVVSPGRESKREDRGLRWNSVDEQEEKTECDQDKVEPHVKQTAME